MARPDTIDQPRWRITVRNFGRLSIHENMFRSAVAADKWWHDYRPAPGDYATFEVRPAGASRYHLLQTIGHASCSEPNLPRRGS